MRIYSAVDEESLRLRRFLKDWAGANLLTSDQQALFENDIPVHLRRTNLFLRGVLFLFTIGSVCALAFLANEVLFSWQDSKATGGLWLVFAVLCYGLAEFSVSRFRLYRHGIEEALAVLAVGFLCAGISSGRWTLFSARSDGSQALVLLVGFCAALWVYGRFGYLYAFLASLVFAAGLPRYAIDSPLGQSLLMMALYAGGLGILHLLRRKSPRDSREEEFRLLEAFVWLALYLSAHLQLTDVRFWVEWFPTLGTPTPFPKDAFYWATYVLIWGLSGFVLWRGLREKNRALLDMGLVLTVLTLMTNKSYLGWARHEWDAMIFGAFLVSVVLWVRHWLSQGPGGVRAGLTAQRLSGRDERLLHSLAIASGVLQVPSAPVGGTTSPDPGLGGGSSGGGGASSGY